MRKRPFRPKRCISSPAKRRFRQRPLPADIVFAVIARLRAACCQQNAPFVFTRLVQGVPFFVTAPQKKTVSSAFAELTCVVGSASLDDEADSDGSLETSSARGCIGLVAGIVTGEFAAWRFRVRCSLSLVDLSPGPLFLPPPINPVTPIRPITRERAITPRTK